jgi:hypothetical protein
MFKYISVLSLAIVCIATPVSARALETSAPQIQSPCREPGHQGEGACVVVRKVIPGNLPTRTTALDVSVSKPLIGKVKSFSVIYLYKTQRFAGQDSIGLTVTHRGGGMVSDVYADAPTPVWVSTHDGGRSWSSLKTADMDSVITY